MGLSIGEMAERTGVPASAIRYYESEGLIAPPGRKSGRRTYDADALQLVSMIGRARKAGFSIREIRELSVLLREGAGPADFCDDAKTLARTKVAELERQIEEANRLKQELELALIVNCDREERCRVLSV